MAFVMVLSFSRHQFVRFYHDQATANFLNGHVHAFEVFDSVPRVAPYRVNEKEIQCEKNPKLDSFRSLKLIINFPLASL